MDENDLILKALKSSAPPSKKQYVIQSYDEDIVNYDEDDPIWKMARTEAKRDKRKNKSLEQWIPSDFLRYINTELQVYDLRLERDGLRETTCITKLHDDLLHYVGKENMTNAVLKEYLEWWISNHRLNLQGEKIYIQRMVGRFDIEKFMKQRGTTPPISQTLPTKSDVKSVKPDLDEATLYEVSGLPGLLANKGIVAAYRLLKKKNVPNIFISISSSLQNFSKKMLEATLELTIKSAPYPKIDTVDFLSLARPALTYHNIKKYSSLDYKRHFV